MNGIEKIGRTLKQIKFSRGKLRKTVGEPATDASSLVLRKSDRDMSEKPKLNKSDRNRAFKYMTDPDKFPWKADAEKRERAINLVDDCAWCCCEGENKKKYDGAPTFKQVLAFYERAVEMSDDDVQYTARFASGTDDYEPGHYLKEHAKKGPGGTVKTIAKINDILIAGNVNLNRARIRKFARAAKEMNIADVLAVMSFVGVGKDWNTEEGMKLAVALAKVFAEDAEAEPEKRVFGEKEYKAFMEFVATLADDYGMTGSKIADMWYEKDGTGDKMNELVCEKREDKTSYSRKLGAAYDNANETVILHEMVRAINNNTSDTVTIILD